MNLEIAEAISSGMVDVKSILDNIGIETVPAGSSWVRAICPFHSETEPSFHVCLDHGGWRCFGCHEKGSLVRLIMKVKDIGWKDACDFLFGGRNTRELKLKALKKLINAPSEEKREVNRKSSEHLFTDVYSRGEIFSHHMLHYYERHGIKESTLIKFGVREVFRSYYRYRSIIPLDNGSFEARSYLSENEFAKINPWGYGSYGHRKVLYPKGFHTDSHLWTSRSVRGREVMVTEGIPSAMRFHQLGFVGASIFGSNFSDIHMAKLSGASGIFLFFDEDSAGDDCRENAFDMLNDQRTDVYEARLPRRDCDPCDCTDEELVYSKKNAKNKYQKTITRLLGDAHASR